MLYRIATQFPYRLWLLLGVIMRISCRLTFGLELVVGSTFDIPQNFGGDVPICPSLYTMLHTIQFLLVIDGTADPSKISLEFLCNF